MEKTEARKQLDTYIDTCLDCDGAVTPERNCYTCPTLPKVITVVQQIRAEIKNKSKFARFNGAKERRRA